MSHERNHIDHPDPDDKGCMKTENELRRRGEKDKDRREDRDRKEWERDDRDYEHDNNREYNMRNFPHKLKQGGRGDGFGAEVLHQGCDGDEHFSLHSMSSPGDDKSSVKSECINT